MLVDRRAARAGDDRADPRAARRRGRARRRRAVAGRLDRRRRPVRGDGARCSTRTGATRSPTRPGRCTCSGCRRRCPSRATSRSRARCRCCARSRTTTRSSGSRPRARRPTRASRTSPASASPGRTESEIAADLAGFLREHGHSQVDFTVVGSGPNGANPHHEMSERVDRGRATWSCSTSAASRTATAPTPPACVHVGEPTDEEREVFEIVRRAQQAGFEAVRPGVACQEIDRAARKVISRRRLRRVLHPPGRATASASRPTSRRTWSRARRT